MFTSTSAFAKRRCDDDFHALDAGIAAVARAIPGELGEQARENAETGLVSNVYDRVSMDALQALMTPPEHIRARRPQARSLKGYQVGIAQVVRSCGDNGIAHPLASVT